MEGHRRSKSDIPDTSNDEAIARLMQEEEPEMARLDTSLNRVTEDASESRSAAASPLPRRKDGKPSHPPRSGSRFFHRRSRSSGDTKITIPSPVAIKPTESLSELASATYGRLKGRFDSWRAQQRLLAEQREGSHRGLSQKLTQIGLPRLAAQELVNIFKKFIFNFEQLCVDPTVTTEMMSESVLVLYIQVEDAMISSQVWTTIDDELRETVQGLFEKFVMDQLYDLVFNANEDDEKEDLNLSEKIRGLRWVTYEHLDAKINLEIPEVQKNFELSQDSLIMMDAQRAPIDKLELVVTASKAIFEVINGSADGSPAGADDFLPVLIYVIIKANPPMLYSNLQYVTRFCNPQKLSSGEAGYFYTNLYSAVDFIGRIDAESLRISPKEFERQMKVNDMSKQIPEMENQKKLLESLERLAELDVQHQKIREELDKFETALATAKAAAAAAAAPSSPKKKPFQEAIADSSSKIKAVTEMTVADGAALDSSTIAAS